MFSFEVVCGFKMVRSNDDGRIVRIIAIIEDKGFDNFNSPLIAERSISQPE